MISLDKPDDSLIRHCVSLMCHERSNWKADDVRQELMIDPDAVERLLTDLAGIGQCVIINDTYLTAWLISPQWYNPSEFTIQELLVVKFADGGGTLSDVVDYYVNLSNEYGSHVMIGDLLSSRQATYGRALRAAGAFPFASAYTV